jgi:NAD(P)-dependent dehydrogenase (short-subunit alcohol dehydrogenase family)
MTDMQGKICVVTGATSGIGKATALGLARLGATVVLVARNQSKGEATRAEIITQSGNSAVDLLLADLSSQQSVRRLAESVKQNYPRLDVLVNNAGLFSLRRHTTVDGIELTLAVNYLAPFLLTNLLLDLLKASAPARIVNVSSSSHEEGYIRLDDLQMKRGYRPMRAYGQSKLALILFTYELARRLEGSGVTVNALHPGFVATNIGQTGLPPIARAAARLVLRRGITPEEGANTSIYLASSPEVEGVTGKYFARSAPRRSVEISYDEALQRQLWEVSERLVGLKQGFPILKNRTVTGEK